MTTTRHDRFAAAALVHLRELVRVATRVTGNAALAEDLVQEAYLQAWRSFDRFVPETNCRAWLHTILFRVIGHHWRRRGEVTTESFELLAERQLPVEPKEGDPLARQRVVAAFAELAPEHRSVIMLADIEGMRYREVAEVLGIPIGTVMSRLNRARRRLRARLGLEAAADPSPASERAAHRWGLPS